MKMYSIEFYELLQNVINYQSMNWEPFKCFLCCQCLCVCGTLLEPLTLEQEVVGSNTTVYKFLF